MHNLRLIASPDSVAVPLKRSKCVYLLHPRTEKESVFIIVEGSGKIFELKKISLPKRSLFLGNSVCKCGDIYVPSPINVVFLFIPALLKSDKFTTFDNLLRSDGAPGFPEFFPDSCFTQLAEICDTKETCGLKVLRLSETRLMDWLDRGVGRICAAAHQISDAHQNLHLRKILSVSGGASATSPLFAEGKALRSAELDESALRGLAFQIVADKLPVSLVDKLFAKLGLTSLPAAGKENEPPETTTTRKSAASETGPNEDYSRAAAPPAKTTPLQTASQAKRMKMAKGTKSLMCFFTKK